MNRAVTALATLLMSCVLPCAGVFASSEADARDKALCQRIAADVRSQPHGTAGDPFAFAVSGPIPWIEVPEPVDETVGDSDRDWSAYHATLTARFHPDTELASTFAEYVPESPQIASLPGNPIHALIATGGTMHCQTFIFFETGPGGQSRKLPDLVRGENDGAFCWSESGGLARANGRPVFLYRYDGATSFEYQLGIVPLDDGHWGEGCRVDATYQTLYTASTVSAPNGIASGEFEAAALALARKGQFGTGQAVAFSAVPASQRDGWNLLQAAARTVVDLDWHEPSYGPLVLGQKVYFATATRQGVGWRENTDVQIDLYGMVQGRVQKVGSASLSAARGKLLDVKVLSGGVPP